MDIVTVGVTAEQSLTGEQQAVVEQPAAAAVLVTAGAGAGKTHTLVERIAFLAEECARTDTELLSLSFSRAAVRVLRDRLRGRGELAVTVRSRTIDGWALELLTEFSPDQSWREVSFEKRITAATELIESGVADERYENGLSHVLVDEVQDLVGARRQLIQSLLGRYTCGFTVVGDLAQSIYGFQITQADRRRTETGAFVRWLRAEFGEGLVELALTENFRARTDEARAALAFGPGLRAVVETGRDDENAYEQLREVLRRTTGEVEELDTSSVLSALARFDRSTGILCRTNGEALRVAETLARASVSHQLRREMGDRAVPGWIADLFVTAAPTKVNEQGVRERAAAAGWDDDAAWRALRRVAGSAGSIDLRRLAEAISTGRIPEDVLDGPWPALTVSSFHRAKGLEFDRVLVVDPGPVNPADEDLDLGERTRALYVAMTRSRDELWRVAPMKQARIWPHERTGRWVRFGYKNWQRHGMEIAGLDVDALDPGGSFDSGPDPVDVQRLLRYEVVPGDEVVVRRVSEDAADDLAPPYALEWRGHVIGRMSERFRRDLHRVLKLSRTFEVRAYPSAVENIRIDQIETVAGSDASGRRAGLGSYGVWRAPRLAGLGRFAWGSTDV